MDRHPETWTLSARWIFPVSQPPLADGFITIRGERIASVEPRQSRSVDFDLGNAAIIPGLANAHTHLDLSGARGQIPPTDAEHFPDWLRQVIAFRRSRSAEALEADIAVGMKEALAAGTTLLGDITVAGASYSACRSAALRSVLFWEVIGLSPERFAQGRNSYETMTKEVMPATDMLRWAISPHAPYSVNHAVALEELRRGNVALHLAESPAERELLESHAGSFVPFLQELGVWNPDYITGSLFDFLHAKTPDTHPRLLVHGNYLPVDAPLTGDHSLVFCPRTHAAFQHPRHPYREFLNRGIRVCLGTDSLASNPDLDILAEARFLHERDPDLPGETLLRMATLAGAEALGWADECGSLEAGKSADLVAVPLPNRDEPDPHRLLFAADAPMEKRKVLFRGVWRGA